MAKKQTNTQGRLIVKIVVAIVIVLVGVGVLAILINGNTIPVLDPKGEIADKERTLIIVATLLGLIVVIPVFVMLFYVAWKYREGNTKAKYDPEWSSSKAIEGLWWSVPLVIITILGVITWQTSHELDPYRPLTSETKPVKVQVVALQWRWLFIYPEYNVASMNKVNFPVNTPVNFEITADAPMNSFWIPSLGSQVYAMSGMSTKLHLQADSIGNYDGRSANISGEGFADMTFVANAVTQDDFTKWVEKAKKEGESLDRAAYERLSEPSRETAPVSYTLKQPDLYDTIVMKYMGSH